MSELEKESQKMCPLVCVSCLQHLYLRYLLGIGDSGTHNILFNETQNGDSLVTGIDLEEVNSSNKMKTIDKMKKLFKSHSSLQKKIYEPYLNKIKVFDRKLSNEQEIELVKIRSNTDEINKRITEWDD